MAGDLRPQIGELALLVQRLVDHRAQVGVPTEEVELFAQPIEALVSEIESTAKELVGIDEQLKGLSEADLVRALASAEARGLPEDTQRGYLEGLDRLRFLEDERAKLVGRLLEASSLLRRSVEMGLGVENPAAVHEYELKRALAVLSSSP